MTTPSKWEFTTRFRRKAYGWNGSSLAVQRLKEAVSEIKRASKKDPIRAADGCVKLMERLWPSLQDIDTSSGALGGAVYRTLEALIPVLIAAPADVATRGKWLERLYQAVLDDGVEYLGPVEEQWGTIAVYPELMNNYADLLLPRLRRAWSDTKSFGHMSGIDICLSSLLEAGRTPELFEVLALPKHKFWSYQKFGAAALIRSGQIDAAIAFADACRVSGANHEEPGLDRYCEQVLLKAGRSDEAYKRFGPHLAAGPTYLASHKDLQKRYPARLPRQLLLDLIEAHGNKGKWFAAAKESGQLDIAIQCAGEPGVESATVIRAARDFRIREPIFALAVAQTAIRSILAGGGYDPSVADIEAAFDHLIVAARQLGIVAQTRADLTVLANKPVASDRLPFRVALARRLATKPAFPG